jgi:hypothetical protein
MSMNVVPTPKPNEKFIGIIEIPGPPEGMSDKSPEYEALKTKFEQFREELHNVIIRHFPGTLKIKVILKQKRDGDFIYRA